MERRAKIAVAITVVVAACSKGAAPQVRCEPRAGHAKGSASEHDPEKWETGFPTRSCFTEENGAQSVQLETIAL